MVYLPHPFMMTNKRSCLNDEVACREAGTQQIIACLIVILYENSLTVSLAPATSVLTLSMSGVHMFVHFYNFYAVFLLGTRNYI